MRAELAWEAARLGRRPLASIFFGGGTPSLMDPATAGSLIADAKRLFDPAPGLEVTLEANPTSVEAGRLAGFRDAGVNRISLGVQSLEDAPLRMLGRQHSAAEAVAALEMARRIFPRLSFDLIYARPGQTLAAWQAELHRALALAADHLSLYQLTIEPGTAFEALHRARRPAAARRGGRRRPVRGDGGGGRPGTAWRSMRSPTTPSPAPRAATTSPTGATGTTPASARGRMAGSCSATG